MIARFTPGADRARLGFAEAVRKDFRFLEVEYGFHVVCEDVTFVRYESERLFVNGFHGRGSFEIGVEVGRLLDLSTHYRLPDLIQALAPDAGSMFFQASDPEAVAACVHRAAQALRTHCAPILKGDDDAFRRVADVAAAKARALTLQAQYGAVIDSADRAWDSKDLSEALKLYAKAEPALDEARKRRLEYLRRNTAD